MTGEPTSDPDPGEGPARHRAGARHCLWLGAGWLFVAIGAVGAVVPLLPTTSFLLLAAFCFSRSSPRLHHWLISHPTFGPPIRDWREHGAIRRSAKALALLGMGASVALAAAFRAPKVVILVQIIFLSACAAFIASRPTAPPPDG
ncbi:MAG: DUF454 family protein [Alphaproteobacteria bacterium]|nr:DUF454 family protein [Alphaproteobacteria bacterium]